MAGSILTQANCLSAGADLWIIPKLDENQASPKVDWYLNFQISKMERHHTPLISERLKYILDQTELQPAPLHSQKSFQLLIPTQGALPCRWVVVNESSDFKTWVESSIQIWKSLKQPTARFFLPSGMKPVQFEEIWKSYGQFDDYSVVID